MGIIGRIVFGPPPPKVTPSRGQQLFAGMIEAKHKREDQSGEIERLRTSLRQIVKYTNECSDPQGWLAFNVRYAAESGLGVQGHGQSGNLE